MLPPLMSCLHVSVFDSSTVRLRKDGSMSPAIPFEKGNTIQDPIDGNLARPQHGKLSLVLLSELLLSFVTFNSFQRLSHRSGECDSVGKTTRFGSDSEGYAEDQFIFGAGVLYS